jgi:outer membrane protein
MLKKSILEISKIMIKRGRFSRGFLCFLWISIALLSFLLNLDVSAQKPEVQTLLSCYHLALKQSEEVAVNQEKIKEVEGLFLQSLSTILPRLSYDSSLKRQDSSGSNSNEIVEGKFIFTQPLFRGFKEFAAIASSRHQQKHHQYQLDYAKLLLFRDVADAVYLYLRYQQDLEVLNGIHQILLERWETLKKRETLGRSRLSDTVSVETQLRRLEADMETVSGQKEVAGQLLEFLTGVAIQNLVDDVPIEKELQEIDVYMQQVSRRPDVLAQKETVESAREQVKIVRSGYFPEILLEGNQYTRREGSSRNVDWDVLLSVEIPLFQGGEIRGAVHSAHAMASQEELRYSEIQRRAEQEVKNAYTLFLSALRRQDALVKVMEFSQKNYELQLEDFQINLVNNLDVLEALEKVQDSRREYMNIQNEVKQLYWQFKTAVGDIPDDAI